MKVKALIGGSVVGLGALVASFAPIVPTNMYTFTSSNDNRCEVRQAGRQTSYSWLRGKFGNYGDSNDSNRVVRVYETNGRYYRFGTGYILDDGLMLTANHVTEGMKRPVVSNGEDEYTGRVVANDPKRDLALVSIPVNGEFGPTRIGNSPKPGENVTIKTLDVGDYFYKNGPSNSRRDIRQFKYDGRISAESQRTIQELEQKKRNLQLQIGELDKRQDALFEPYSPSSKKETLPREPARDSMRLDRGIDSEILLHYMHKTDNDHLIPGMSGSSLFNRGGELVGVGISTITSRPVSGSGGGYGYGFPKEMPEDIQVQIMKIKEKEQVIYKEIDGIESQIYSLENPFTVTDGGVSPTAILDFLKGYCDSSGIQPSAMQPPRNSNGIEESLEQTLEPHSKFIPASLMRYGFGNNPPKSIEQIIHPRKFTKGGWRK